VRDTFDRTGESVRRDEHAALPIAYLNVAARDLGELAAFDESPAWNHEFHMLAASKIEESERQ